MTWLFLDNNDFISIPSAIGKLKHLETLSLLDNSHQQVLVSIRHTLTQLQLSLQSLATWPDAIQYLTKLQRLAIKSFSHNIPVDAFRAFRTSLIHLDLDDVNFTTVPSAVCGLHNLEHLHIATIGQLNGKSLINCNQALTSLSDLILYNNLMMTTFPYVFSVFPNLDRIRISGSGISFINDYLVPNDTKISRFVLATSNLTTVPGAVNKFPLLQEGNLQQNMIRSIEKHSIENLPHLTSLFLNDNPIVFISRNAFQNVHHLTHLGLEKTWLTTMPLLVETIPSLTVIDLMGGTIICNCEFPRDASRITINGHCHVTNEAISNFIRTTLPQCP